MKVWFVIVSQWADEGRVPLHYRQVKVDDPALLAQLVLPGPPIAPPVPRLELFKVRSGRHSAGSISVELWTARRLQINVMRQVECALMEFEVNLQAALLLFVFKLPGRLVHLREAMIGNGFAVVVALAPSRQYSMDVSSF